MSVQNEMNLKKRVFVIEKKINHLLQYFDKKIPVPKYIQRKSEKEINQMSDFSVCVDDCGEKWFLGYSNLSITPIDIDQKKYYVGGNISFPPREIKEIIDDVKVRTVCLSVKEQGEKIILSSVDCIGLTNVYVDKIREELQEFCVANNVKSINIFSTHTHSSVDTMGVWSINMKKLAANIIASQKNNNPQPTVDFEYMDFLINKVKTSIIESVKNITPGELFFLKIGNNSADSIRKKFYKKIGFDENTDVWNKSWEKILEHELENLPTSELGIYQYILAKRSPFEFLPCITRIRFQPFDKEKKGTVIVNFSAHPYSNGLKIKKEGSGNVLSGDFPYYMEKIFNENNYNFVFFNGALNGIYPKRESTKIGEKESRTTLRQQTETIGFDLAGIILSADLLESEVYSNPTLCPNSRSKVYCSIIKRNKEPIAETEIKPTIFTSEKSIILKCSNPIELIIGKLNFSQFKAYITEQDEMYIKSEIGFIQMGDELKIALMPGEITPGLLTGNGDMNSKNTLKKNTGDFYSLKSIFDEHIIVFGLANDAIGYVIPDNDFCMVYVGTGRFAKKLFGKSYTHYQEIFSIGEKTASCIMKNTKLLKMDIDNYRNQKADKQIM